MDSTFVIYGKGDNTYRAMGERAGISRLVHTFYDFMEHKPDYRTIWSWHTEDRTIMRDKLSKFLFMWSGGPKDYIASYGPISIPSVHCHLNVTARERDQWLSCMHEAMCHENYPQDLIDYLLHHFSIPADRIRQICESQRA